MRQEETRSILDIRSVLVAVAVLLVGAALGFGVGYKYEKHTAAASKSHDTASSSKSVTPATSANNASASSVAKMREVVAGCMAKEGVKYSSPDDDTSKPPPGVSTDKYNAARTICYKLLVTKP